MQVELIEPEVQSPADTALSVVNQNVAELNQIEAGFAELESRYKDVVYPVDTTAGMDEAKKARQEIRKIRYRAQEIVKITKQSINQVKSDFDAEGQKVIARVAAVEDPIDKQIKAYEEAKEAEKAKAEQEAREAAAKIEASMTLLRFNPALAMAANSYEVAVVIERIQNTNVTLEEYADRAGEAMQLKAKTLEQLQELHASVVAREKEQERIAEEKRAIEEHRIAIEKQQAEFLAEQKRIADEQQKKLDDERAAFKAEQDAFRAELAKKQAEEEAARKAVAEAELKKRQEADQAEQKKRDEAEAIVRAEQERMRAQQEAQRIALEAEDLRIRGLARRLLVGLEWALGEINVDPCEWSTEEQTDAHRDAIAVVKEAKGEKQ